MWVCHTFYVCYGEKNDNAHLLYHSICSHALGPNYWTDFGKNFHNMPAANFVIPFHFDLDLACILLGIVTKIYVYILCLDRYRKNACITEGIGIIICNCD